MFSCVIILYNLSVTCVCYIVDAVYVGNMYVKFKCVCLILLLQCVIIVYMLSFKLVFVVLLCSCVLALRRLLCNMCVCDVMVTMCDYIVYFKCVNVCLCYCCCVVCVVFVFKFGTCVYDIIV